MLQLHYSIFEICYKNPKHLYVFRFVWQNSIHVLERNLTAIPSHWWRFLYRHASLTLIKVIYSMTFSIIHRYPIGVALSLDTVRHEARRKSGRVQKHRERNARTEKREGNFFPLESNDQSLFVNFVEHEVHLTSREFVSFSASSRRVPRPRSYSRDVIFLSVTEGQTCVFFFYA